MLKPNSLHKALPIVVSPEGEYWTPTYPENYSEGEAVADAMMGTRKYFFQRVRWQIQQRFWLRKRLVWQALDETRSLRGVRALAGWKILHAKAFTRPTPVTPLEALRETNLEGFLENT